MSSELVLDRALDELVERCDSAHGDWDDVLRRAGVEAASQAVLARAPVCRPRLRLHHRRLVLALALFGLLLTVLLATPAFGVRHLILDVLGGRTNIPFHTTKPAPALVRREFANLTFGAPPSMDPQAIISESRTVASFRVGGKPHTLWVAPTRRGGFCWVMSEAFGGCLNQRDIRSAPPHELATGEVHPELLSVSWLGSSPQSSVPGRIEGVVLGAKAARMTAEFRDSSSADIPFVFVSAPIGAGFFYWDVPKAQEQVRASLRAVTARDSTGAIIARTLIPLLTRRPRPIHVPKIPLKPLPPPPPLGFHIPDPRPPFQHGSGDGVSVTVGANGVVVFDTTGIAADRQAVLGHGVGCFKIEHDQLGLWPRELTVLRNFGPTIKIRLTGVPHPYDGCEVQGGYGHTWPDRLGSHSAIEVPLTATGRRYFIDRAAARDLALFVRSKRGHKLRRETGTKLRHDVTRIGSPRIVELPSAGASPRVGKIGYAVTAKGVTFVELSPTGKRFYVVVRNGEIRTQNVKPYSYVW
jgi:hypothetical protein